VSEKFDHAYLRRHSHAAIQMRELRPERGRKRYIVWPSFTVHAMFENSIAERKAVASVTPFLHVEIPSAASRPFRGKCLKPSAFLWGMP